ncbi:putative AAA family ATPase [Tricharina praecox]|uniref:putative AAA family ATPase n=1 Tax=Tricharina praecox TaxID=43433 RepID=UPI00221EB796|nr:putative AAA family ATPase [Tricharina praecox]KAI5856965.1 putative AAA family ATPase [Tricharina praecox]
MPKRTLKRDVTTEDLLKSDSDDENYDDHAVTERSPRKSRKTPGKKPSGKKKGAAGGAGRGRGKPKKTNRYDSEDEDDIEDTDLSEILTEEDAEEEEEPTQPVAIGRNGRPRRGAALKAQKNATVMAQSSDSESIESNSHDGESDSDKELNPRRSAAAKAPGTGPTTIIVLKYKSRLVAQTQDPPDPEGPQPTRRVTRATSATPAAAAAATPSQTQSQRPAVGGKGPMGGYKATRGRGASAEPSRRSGRLAHTDVPLAAFSNSGKHVVLSNLQPTAPSDIPEESSVEESREHEQDEEVPEKVENADEESGDDDTGASNKQQGDVEAQESQTDQTKEDDVPETTTAAAEVGESISRDDTGHEADEDEDDGPTKRIRTRAATSRPVSTPSPRTLRSAGDPTSSVEKSKKPDSQPTRRLKRGAKRAGRATSRKAGSEDEDYHEEGEEAEQSDDSMSSRTRAAAKPQEKANSSGEDGEYSDARSSRKRARGPGSEEPESQAELQQELEDLQPSPKRPRRTQRRQFSGNESATATEPRLRRRVGQVDYRILRPEMAAVLDDNDAGTSTPSKRRAGNALSHSKSLFDTNGPFGGDVVPFFGRHTAPVDIDSDSSDEEAIRRRGRGTGLGGMSGMTPTGAHAPGLLPAVAQTHNADALQAGAPANLGKVTKSAKNALADADPLGISPDVTFDSIGGLDDRIQQLKEMVMLPLMYPEIFKAKKVTPPRGVLFHGPPGTGKTLLARAVASSFTGADGKKVTFYMRKGADCLSKWVGEAERQLRLLFDEARANQPSIIFFDEIDGLAPVRSSKQEQIHASIVSTLLALMDGMDGRGQVVVIGATNRPDSVDPALRRPGRFDREFYFPLPTTEARRAILDIHSKGWEPPLADEFKDQLAKLTKGYGGADLRALCTEAALNAMQRTYPQIYKSLDKLKVDPHSVIVTARDFMMSLRKITPSSERSTASGASPLPEHVVPLLSKQLERVKECLKGIFPEFKRLTPLEEAEYEDDVLDAEEGFAREMMMENFESARIYRPRLLIHGTSGLGQQYLAAAVLHFMEKVHVQSFDLATLLSDATRTPETALVQFFTEIKRHKPSVIFIPNVDVWYRTLPAAAIAAFKGLLQSIAPNDRVLLFGISEVPVDKLDPDLTRDLFGYSKRDRFELERPDEGARFLYFDKVMSHIRKSPRDFPQDPTNRKKRKLPELERASPPPKREQTDDEKRAIALRDRQLKNHLKLRLNNLMENLKQKYRRFKKPVIEHEVIIRILDPPAGNSSLVESDIPAQPERFRPYQDADNVLRVEDTLTGKVYYNMDLDIIEDRFSNGFYSTPRQFLMDVERIRHDAKLVGDKENQRKANEMLTNAEVYIADIEMDTAFVGQCEDMYQREKQRASEKKRRAEQKKTALGEQQKLLEAGSRNGSRPGSKSNSESTAIAGMPHETPIVIPKTPAPKQPVGGLFGEQSGFDDSAMFNVASSAAATGGTTHPPESNRDSNFSLYHTPPLHRPMMAPSQPTQLTQMGSGPGGIVGVALVATTDLSVIVNDASTTTSGGKRTSDGTAGTGSQPHSNPQSNSNGYGGDSHDQLQQWGDFGIPGKGDSQLPATQVLQSSQGQHSSQGYAHSTPASQATGPIFPYSQTDSSPASVPHPSQVWPIPPPPVPMLKCSAAIMEGVQKKLTQGTSGYNVEQLEQVNAAIMDYVWKSRTNYNREEVARQALEVFNEVNGDIQSLQRTLAVSGSFE